MIHTSLTNDSYPVELQTSQNYSPKSSWIGPLDLN